MATETVNIVVTTRGATVAAQQIRSIGTSSRGALISVRALGTALLAIGGSVAVRGMLKFADSATNVSNKLRTTTNSTAEFLSVQDRLFDVANRTGQTIENTAQLYQRLTVGTRELGVGTARVINVVEGLQAALLVSGSTARESSAALLQFGQAIASDALGGEELRSLRENLPQVAQGIAKELETNIGALKALGRQGKLTAEEVFTATERAIVSFQEKLKNGEVVFTFAQAFTVLKNEVVKAFEIIQRATGVTTTLNKAIIGFADGLAEKIVGALANGLRAAVGLVGAFEKIKTTITDVVDGLGGFYNIILNIKDIFIGLVDVLILPFSALRLKIAQVAGGLTKLGNFVGLGGIFSDEEVAAQDERIQRSKEAITSLLDDLSARAGNVGARLSGGIAESADAAKKSLSPWQQAIMELADSLDAAAKKPPLVNTKDKVPTFFERAEKNTLRIQKENDFADVDVPIDLAKRISESFQQGFASAIQNGDDIFQAISKNFEAAANQALVAGFQDAFDSVQGLLEESFKSAAAFLKEILPESFSGIGSVFANAIGGALQFVALQALSALFGGGGNKESRSNGNIQSAVTSTQAVRGIVAGPTEIAIANVGRNIAEAVEPLIQETAIQTAVLREILGAVVSGGGTLGAFGADALALAAGGSLLATS